MLVLGDINTPTHSGNTFNKRPRLEAAAKQEDQRYAVMLLTTH